MIMKQFTREFFNAVKAKAKQLVAKVQEAREPVELEPDVETFACAVPGTDQAIVLPKVKTFDHPPTPEESRAEARRMALAYAREHTGNPELTWKQAKLVIARLEKEERALEQQQKKEAAAPAPTTIAMKKIVIAGARAKVTR